MNFSIHKAGLYIINIVKILIQASLLAKTAAEDNMIYNIISQSSTSPFLKKSKLQQPNVNSGGGTLNTDTLLIDISDGSKDNSSNNTPNFASPKSANNGQGTDVGGQTFKINEDDLDVVPVRLNKKHSQVCHI